VLTHAAFHCPVTIAFAPQNGTHVCIHAVTVTVMTTSVVKKQHVCFGCARPSPNSPSIGSSGFRLLDPPLRFDFPPVPAPELLLLSICVRGAVGKAHGPSTATCSERSCKRASSFLGPRGRGGPVRSRHSSDSGPPRTPAPRTLSMGLQSSLSRDEHESRIWRGWRCQRFRLSSGTGPSGQASPDDRQSLCKRARFFLSWQMQGRIRCSLRRAGCGGGVGGWSRRGENAR
jgi:hypothetical protein